MGGRGGGRTVTLLLRPEVLLARVRGGCFGGEGWRVWSRPHGGQILTGRSQKILETVGNHLTL